MKLMSRVKKPISVSSLFALEAFDILVLGNRLFSKFLLFSFLHNLPIKVSKFPELSNR